MRELVQRVARTWLVQLPGRAAPVLRPRVPPVRPSISEAQFERAMELIAQAMGGRYIAATSTIKLPRIGKPGDDSFPTELQVLYRRFPRGMLLPEADPNDPATHQPYVSFDELPNTPGDPRQSRIYRTFTGEAAASGILFRKFLGWLKILTNAVNRYAREAEQETASVRIARKWLMERVRQSEPLHA